jgi:hypothetical protein
MMDQNSEIELTSRVCDFVSNAATVRTSARLWRVDREAHFVHRKDVGLQINLIQSFHRKDV